MNPFRELIKLIAYILYIPAWIVVFLYAALGSIPAIIAYIPYKLLVCAREPKLYKDEHVIVTGGSSGIGFYLAQKFAEKGSKVTLIARKQELLEKAVQKIKDSTGNQNIQYYCADTSNYTSIQVAIKQACISFGPPEYFLANAGTSEPGYFLEQDNAVHEKTMKVNYFGLLYSIKSVLPFMIPRKRGHVVVTCSSMGICGFIGYSSYAPSKWAIRGLMDCLRNELKSSGIIFSISYPPDTDTEGFKRELENKPKESQTLADVYPVATVCDKILNGIDENRYHLPSPDPFQDMLTWNMSGIGKRTHILFEVAMAGGNTLGEWIWGNVGPESAAKGYVAYPESMMKLPTGMEKWCDDASCEEKIQDKKEN